MVVVGGSGFVWTSATSSNVPSGYSVSTSYYLTNASTYSGNTSFTSTSGGTETGHSGNGYAKITPVTITGSPSTTSSTKPEQPQYIKEGLILHYDAINNTGNGHSNTTTTWKDLSGNNNNGTFSKAPNTSNFYWEENCITLSNSSSTLNSYIDTPINLNNKERTIIYTVDANNLQGTIWGDTDSSNTNGFFNYYTFIANRGNSTGVQNRYDYTFSKSGIYNYAVSISYTEIKFYENGVLKTTLNNTVGLATKNNLRLLAGRYNNQSATNLKMYNFLVYDRVLTDSEIQKVYSVAKKQYNF